MFRPRNYKTIEYLVYDDSGEADALCVEAGMYFVLNTATNDVIVQPDSEQDYIIQEYINYLEENQIDLSFKEVSATIQDLLITS